MRIGIIIGRIGGIDGVALETEKWIDVLKKIGHEIYIISGQYQERKINTHYETLVPEMSFFSPESYWGQKKAFFFPDTNTQELLDHINMYSDVIAEKILKWINKNKIEVLLSENASALPSHLEMGWAIKKVVEKTGLPTITHDHDFAWERGNRYVSPHKEINEFVEKTFPLREPNVINAVINLYGKETLKQKFGIDAIVVPNVMDFNVEFGKLTPKNQSLRTDLGLTENDILLFQITRIVRRKGIETAIKLIEQLNDKRIKLVITGSKSDDAGALYFHELMELIHELNLHQQIIFASHIINNKGLRGNGNERNYSLSDAYAHARATTYFSIYEGFGNAFVESVLAKRPIFVNNYKPVYWPDIGSKGFKTVMLENNELTNEKVKEMQEIIFNEKLNKEIAEFNYELGKKYFSYETLTKKLEEILEKVERLKR
ncbi:MAG: glycosyltransferase family 4 protein [Chlorobi bacterium]|nr:glycosyltransferase family 4 protein [Chlorobiota bacterium]